MCLSSKQMIAVLRFRHAENVWRCTNETIQEVPDGYWLPTHFILPSSIFICGEKEGLAFGVYISIFFFCFSFELMCSRLGLSKETCVEPLSGFPASTISLTFDNIPFPSSVSYPPPHPFQISPFSLPPSLCPSNPIRPQMLGSAIFIFSTVRVCAQVSSLSRRCTCVWACMCLSLKHAKGMVHVYIDSLCCRYCPAL